MEQAGELNVDVEALVGRRPVGRWERVSVGDLLERGRWSYPDKDAIVGAAGACSSPRFSRLSYRAADDLANRIANGLLARGLQRGDRLMFFCENSVEAYITKFGAAKAGIVCAPLNPKLAEDVQDYLVRLLAPKFAIVDAELWPAAAAVLARHGLQGVIIPIGGANIPPGWVGFESFVDAMPATEPQVEIHGDDIWQIIPTSGTTAMPKAVMMSHHFAYFAAYSHAMSHTRGLRWEADLRICSLLPVIYHAGDQSHSFPAYLAGGTFVLGRRAAAADVAEVVTSEKVTALWAGSPQFIQQIVEAVQAAPGSYDLGSLTSILYTWAALPPTLADELKLLCRKEVQLVEILGQTEALSCTRFWPDRWPEIYRAAAPKTNHVGVPNPLLAAAIMDENGRLMERSEVGKPGEIVYRSPVITAGYYKDPRATREALRHGWFHSGDCCAYDANGLLVMLDRYKDVVKSGGENVSTPRVEAVIMSHPAVRKAAVVGLPHERWGEAVTAFVILRPGEDPGEEALLEFCRSRLAGYEAPKRIVAVDSLPETVGGKTLKHVLRSRHAGLYVGGAA